MSEQQTDTAKSGAVRTLRRELKARHLAMIAIGGSIGTGLFVASGATVAQAGPGRIALLRINRTYGLFPYDQPWRVSGIYACFRIFFNLWL